jgi:hypothetical protein
MFIAIYINDLGCLGRPPRDQEMGDRLAANFGRFSGHEGASAGPFAARFEALPPSEGHSTRDPATAAKRPNRAQATGYRHFADDLRARMA